MTIRNSKQNTMQNETFFIFACGQMYLASCINYFSLALSGSFRSCSWSVGRHGTLLWWLVFCWLWLCTTALGQRFSSGISSLPTVCQECQQKGGVVATVDQQWIGRGRVLKSNQHTGQHWCWSEMFGVLLRGIQPSSWYVSFAVW